MRKHPQILQINAFFYLSRLLVKYGRSLTLATIPQDEWQEIADKGFDLVWLMGVWERSPEGRKMALAEPNLRRAFDEFLPGWGEHDVAGSPYAIYRYEPDPFVGKEKVLHLLRSNLSRSGLRLVLDFVPNHFALDHPWTLMQPSYFVKARNRKVLKEHPDWFFETRRGVYLAHGRDPYFAPWNDTVQVNFYSRRTRQAMLRELLRIAEVCDGVRCDMAMLGLNQIFSRVWGPYVAEKTPVVEFWTEVIGEVKRRHPDFIFIAEVYWDLEWDLQQLGFDYTYDKRLYDRLKLGNVGDVHGHLLAEAVYQNRSMRFIENHDEDRAAFCLGREKSQAAAVIITTVPGLRFMQDGQMEGKLKRTPIHLRRETSEKTAHGMLDFYRRLMAYAQAPVMHVGTWKLLEPYPSSEDNPTFRNMLVWCWVQEEDWRLIAVNYSDTQSQARVPVHFMLGNGKQIRLRDCRSGEIYRRDAQDLERNGLYIDLKPWQCHLFEPAEGS